MGYDLNDAVRYAALYSEQIRREEADREAAEERKREAAADWARVVKRERDVAAWQAKRDADRAARMAAASAAVRGRR